MGRSSAHCSHGKHLEAICRPATRCPSTCRPPPSHTKMQKVQPALFFLDFLEGAALDHSVSHQNRGWSSPSPPPPCGRLGSRTAGAGQQPKMSQPLWAHCFHWASDNAPRVMRPCGGTTTWDREEEEEIVLPSFLGIHSQRGGSNFIHLTLSAL